MTSPAATLRAIRNLCAALLVVTCVHGCHSAPAISGEGVGNTVNAYVAAYNAHDIEQMLAMVTDDIRWMSISATEISVVTAGQPALADALRAYFADLPSARSRVRQMSANGAFVSVIEEAQWESNGVMRSQCGLAVYEIRDKLIANVWYHAAQPCDAAN